MQLAMLKGQAAREAASDRQLQLLVKSMSRPKTLSSNILSTENTVYDREKRLDCLASCASFKKDPWFEDRGID